MVRARLLTLGVLLAALPVATMCTAPNPAYRPAALDGGESPDTSIPGDLARDSGPADLRLADGPTGFALAGPTETPLRGASGGAEYRDLCPAPDQVLVGMTGADSRAGGIGSVRGVCGQLTLTWAGAMSVVGTAGTTPLGLRGKDAYDPWTSTCPAGEVVVGIDGRAGAWMDALAVVCAPLTMAAEGRGVTWGRENVLMVQGSVTSGGTAFSDRCGAGQVANGTFIRAGDWVDGLNLLCATPTATP